MAKKDKNSRQIHIVEACDGEDFVEIYRGVDRELAEKIARQQSEGSNFDTRMRDYSIDSENDLIEIRRLIFSGGYPLISSKYGEGGRFQIDDLRTLMGLLNNDPDVNYELRRSSEEWCKPESSQSRFHRELADENYLGALMSKETDWDTAVHKFANAYGHYRHIEDVHKSDLCIKQLRLLGLSDEEIICCSSRGMSDSSFFGNIFEGLSGDGEDT